MKKNITILNITVFAALVLSVIAGMYVNFINKPLNLSSECNLHNNECFFGQDVLKLGVEFMQDIVIEEELTIRFTTNASQTVKSAWIEGENMYMGKIPVMFENRGYKDTIKIGVTFLGSCTQAKMRWRLFVQTKSINSDDMQTYTVLFDSSAE